MAKKLLIIVIVVIVVLIVIMLGVRAFAPRGGTPIIIKGTGDGGDSLEIYAQSNRAKTQANSHSQSGRVENLYVLGGKSILTGYEWCVQYDLPNSIKSSRPHITVSVAGNPNEAEVKDSYLNGVDVLFVDNDYNPSSTGTQYTSKKKLAIQSVNIDTQDLGFKTKCRDKDGNKVDCPAEFKVTADSKLAIVANYVGQSCEAPAAKP